MLLLSLLLVTLGFASDNGKYYECDTTSGYCVFKLLAAADQDPDYPIPTEWGTTAVEHSVMRDTDVGMRKITTIENRQATVSPKPWTNGVTTQAFQFFFKLSCAYIIIKSTYTKKTI